MKKELSANEEEIVSVCECACGCVGVCLRLCCSQSTSPACCYESKFSSMLNPYFFSLPAPNAQVGVKIDKSAWMRKCSEMETELHSIKVKSAPNSAIDMNLFLKALEEAFVP